MADEMIDIVDESGRAIGTMARAETEKHNHAIPNALVFLFTQGNKVWIQKRARTKKHFPGLWDISACGAIASGEEPLEAAQRETLEETGIVADLELVESFMNVFPGQDSQEFRRLSYLYIGETEEQPQVNDEVEEFKAVECDDLFKQLKENPSDFVPSFLIELEKAVKARFKNRDV